jgi:hypothetical protein
MPATTTIRILGQQFTIQHKYTAGHVCTQNEANVLNRALAKGISKGLHKVLAQTRSQHDPQTGDGQAELQRAGEDYIAEFVVGFAQGHERLRAIRLEAERIAKQLVSIQLNAAGRTEIAPGELATMLDELVASEKVRSEAERRVALTFEIAQDAYAELDSGDAH